MHEMNSEQHDHQYVRIGGSAVLSSRYRRTFWTAATLVCALILVIFYDHERDSILMEDRTKSQPSWSINREHSFSAHTTANAPLCQDPQISKKGKDFEMDCGSSGGLMMTESEVFIQIGLETKEISKYDAAVSLEDDTSELFKAGIVKMSIILGNHGYNGRDEPATLPFHFLAHALVQSGAVSSDVVDALKESVLGPLGGSSAGAAEGECSYPHSATEPHPWSGAGPSPKRSFCGGQTCLPSVCGDCCYHAACYGYEYCCSHCTAEERAALGMGGGGGEGAASCGPSGWSLFTGSCDAKYEHYNQCRSTCSAEPLPHWTPMGTAAPPSPAPTPAPTTMMATPAPTPAPTPLPTPLPTTMAPTTMAPTIQTVGCTKGYEENDDGVCIRFTGETATWAVARALCEQEGGFLPSLHSVHENEDLWGVVGAAGSWIGLAAEEGGGAGWAGPWVDGTTTGAFEAWGGAGQPGEEEEGCGYLEGATGEWAAGDCQELRPFLCQVRCPAGYAPSVVGGCLRRGEERLAYADARAACAAEGAALVPIHSDLMNQVVYDFSWGKNVWIGLNDLDQEGQWGWADGSAPIYTNWLPGEPKDMGLKYGEDCVAMGRAAGGRWWDDKCESTKLYVCFWGHHSYEEEARTPAPTAATAVPTAALSLGPLEECDAGWTPTGLGACVKLGSRTKNWNAALELCHAEGAWLATVDSPAMGRVLRGLTEGAPFWTGLTDAGEGGPGDGEGQWRWEDGTPYDWSNWLPNEPNNAGDEDCMLAGWNGRDDRWVDARCQAVYNYVCMYRDRRWTPAPTAGRPTPAPTLAPHPPTPAPTPVPTVFYTKEPLYGSCTADRCGGCSEGNCWCDELCVVMGDCCENNCDICGYGCVTKNGEEQAMMAMARFAQNGKEQPILHADKHQNLRMKREKGTQKPTSTEQ